MVYAEERRHSSVERLAPYHYAAEFVVAMRHPCLKFRLSGSLVEPFTESMPASPATKDGMRCCAGISTRSPERLARHAI